MTERKGEEADRPACIRDRSASTGVTRRGVLGGAATLAAGQAFAAPAPKASPNYRLVYLDERMRDAVALLDEDGTNRMTWPAREFGEKAYFEIGRASLRARQASQGGGAGEAYRPKTWTLTVRRASLPAPEAKTFTMTFVIDRTDELAPWTIALSSDGWWDGGDAVPFRPIQVASFLGLDGLSEHALTAEIAERRAGRILRGFFGPRIESSGRLRLMLSKDLSWRVEPQDARTGALYILHVFLTFRRLTVRRILSEPSAAADGRERVPLLFDAEAPADSRPGSAKRRTDGLYGIVQGIAADDAFPVLERPPAGRRSSGSTWERPATRARRWP